MKTKQYDILTITLCIFLFGIMGYALFSFWGVIHIPSNLKTLYINQTFYPLHFQNTIIGHNNTSMNYTFYANDSNCINKATYQTLQIDYITQNKTEILHTITNIDQIKKITYTSKTHLLHSVPSYERYQINNNTLMSSTNTIIYVPNGFTLVCPNPK